jgi:hypothetical protein
MQTQEQMSMANQFSGSLAERFEEKFTPEPNSGCWLWTGALHYHGYGIIRDGDRMEYAHRTSVQLAGREIPKGMTIDHLCKLKCCVNPDHLEIVTQAENNRRGAVPAAAAWRSGRTHCKNGHEFTPENTNGAYGYRRCRTCNRDRAREHMRNKRSS